MHYFALSTTYLHFALPYFVLGAIGTVFAGAIKTDKICIFCFKLAQNFVMPSTGLFWHCAAPIKFSASDNMAKHALMRKSKNSERIGSMLEKKCALMHNKCNSCKKNMQEFSSHLIQPIYNRCTKFYSNFVPCLI